MQRFFTICLTLCLITQASALIHCYVTGAPNTINNCYYCIYEKLTDPQANVDVLVQGCWPTPDAPVIPYTINGTAQTFGQTNFCNKINVNSASAELYICDKDNCNDKCSAAGYVLGFGLLVAFIAKLFV